MNYVKTTVRLRQPLKEQLERRALEARTTFQELFNQALEKFISQPTGRIKLSDFKLRSLGKMKIKKLDRATIYSDAV